VVGAATPAEWEALMADHHHGAGQPHEHGPAGANGAVAAQSSLALIGTRLLDGLLSLAAGAADLQVLPAGHAALPPLALWLTLLPAAVFLAWRASPPPERPPRPA
jgi:hypothetical protein